MTTTNDERREVAAKMRGNADDMPFYGDLVADAAGADFQDEEDCWNCLADLIDPDNIRDNPGEIAHGLSGSCDRDALLDLADEIERLSSDPKQCGREACAYFGHPDCNCDGCAAYSSDEPCIDLAAKDAASRIRDAIGGVKPDEWIALGEVGALRFPDGHACDMAEWEDAPNGPGSTLDVGTIYAVDEDSYEAVRWVRNNGGLDEVKRRVWASNELEAKLRSRERKIERLKKQLGYAEAKNAERRAGAKWLKEHGGLDAVRKSVERSACRKKLLDCFAMRLGFESLEDSGDLFKELEKRLMPEGMEWLVEAWPRFEDDAPVKFGDMALIDGEADMVEAVQLWIHGKPVIYGDGGSQQLERGECVKRPAPKVLDADGVEIRVGDRLYDTDTGCGRTVRSINANGTVEFEGCEDRGWFTRFLTHRAPVIAADGKPLEAGQTVWTVDAGIKFEVHSIEGDTVWGSLDGDCADDGLDPKSLTHERPVADTWERIEEDAEGGAKGYCYERGIAVDGGAYGQAKAVDLVRRAKKLAERGV